MTKKKYWEEVQPALKTDASCAANYFGLEMRTAAGAVKAASLKGANIA